MGSTSRRRTFWYYLKAFLLGACLLILVLAIAGAGFQALSTSRDLRRLATPGRMIDMGSYELHLLCKGAGAGNDITIILESGLGTTTSVWAQIQDPLARSRHVCSYDRGGIGWSDPSPRPRDAVSMANELSQLLQHAGIDGPLVIVGHSSGGLYARAFRAQFPQRVIAMALLEPTHENQFSSTPEVQGTYRFIKNAYRVLPVAAGLGLARLTPLCDVPAGFPASSATDFHGTCSRTGAWKAQQLEVESLPAAMAQVRDQPDLDALPLLVITAGDDPQSMDNWMDLQDAIAALSTRSTHLVRADSSHLGLLLDAEDAAYVSAAIEDLLASIQ